MEMDFEVLKREIIDRADQIVEDARVWRDEMMARLADAKNSHIMGELIKINARLTAIEDRLPEEEES